MRTRVAHHHLLRIVRNEFQNAPIVVFLPQFDLASKRFKPAILFLFAVEVVLEEIGQVVEDVVFKGIEVTVRFESPQTANTELVWKIKVRTEPVEPDRAEASRRRKVSQSDDEIEDFLIVARVFAWETVKHIPLRIDPELTAPFERLN